MSYRSERPLLASSVDVLIGPPRPRRQTVALIFWQCLEEDTRLLILEGETGAKLIVIGLRHFFISASHLNLLIIEKSGRKPATIN